MYLLKFFLSLHFSASHKKKELTVHTNLRMVGLDLKERRKMTTATGTMNHRRERFGNYVLSLLAFQRQSHRNGYLKSYVTSFMSRPSAASINADA